MISLTVAMSLSKISGEILESIFKIIDMKLVIKSFLNKMEQFPRIPSLQVLEKSLIVLLIAILF